MGRLGGFWGKKRWGFLSVFTAKALYTNHTVFVQRLWRPLLLLFSNPTLGAAECLVRELFLQLYLLFITCWGSCCNSKRSNNNTTTARRAGLSLQFHLPPLGRWTNFKKSNNTCSLWENTLNLTTCGGCDVPARLALTTQTNEKKIGQVCSLKGRQPKQLSRMLRRGFVVKSCVFTCGGTVYFSAFFFSEKKVFHIRKTGRLSRKTVAWQDTVLPTLT